MLNKSCSLVPLGPDAAMASQKSAARPNSEVMLLLLPLRACAILMGIDYGSEYIKAAVASPDAGVHTPTNIGGTRRWRNQMAIWNLSCPLSPVPNESHIALDEIEDLNWELFDAAQSHIDRHPTHAFHGTLPLFGNVFGFHGRELLAIQIRALNLSIDERPHKPKRLEIVFAVFPLTSIPDRLAIAESVKLANGTLRSIVEAHTAVAHLYAREKRTTFSDGMRDILFIDIGATHTWMALFRFEPNGKRPIVTELALAVNETLGGRLIDEQICELFLAKLNLTAEETQKFYPKLLEEARKTKELLTVDESVTVRLDEFGENASATLSRADLDLSEFVRSLGALSAAIQERITTEIHYVEVIGGASRVPFLKDVLASLFGAEIVRRTLNSDEAVALGAAYVGAVKDKRLKLPFIRIDRSIHFSIRLIQAKGEHRLFDETSKSNDKVRKAFTVGRMDFDYTITAQGENLTSFHVHVPETAAPNDTVRFTFRLNHIGAPIVQKVEMWRNQTANLTFSAPSWLLTTEKFNNSLRVMAETKQVAENRLKFGKLKSDMEQFLSEMADRIHNDELFIRVMEDSGQEHIIDAFAEAERWYESVQNRHVRFNEFAEKFRALKAVVYDTQIKCQLLAARRTAWNSLNDTLTKVVTDLVEVWPSKDVVIPADRLKTLWEHFNNTKAWFDEHSEVVLSNSDIRELTVLPAEMDKLRIDLDDFYKFARKAVELDPEPEL